MPPEIKEVEFDVLPAAANEKEAEFARMLAWLLDDLIPIPGTNYRIGLDAVVGLIPGLGDTSTSAVGSLILLQGFRQRVPRVVIARMAVNILLNGLGGAIPGLGDVFSAWFKSNRRNYELLRLHAGTARESTRGDWIFISLVIGVLIVGTIGVAILAGYLAYRVLALIFG